MQLSDLFHNWQNQQPVSYLSKNQSDKKFVRFDMGEFLSTPNAIPYPNVNQLSLKRQLATQWRITKEMISFGTGSDELIERITRVFINPSDKALIVVPTFFRFEDALLRIGANIEKFRLKKSNNFKFTLADATEITKRVNEIKIRSVWLCSPNNPTGVEIDNDFIISICQLTKALVILDSVFFGLFEKVSEQIKLLRRCPNLIILRSLSKINGLAGLRVGIAISHPSLIQPLETWRLPFNIATNSLLNAQSYISRIKSKTRKTEQLIRKERTRLFEKIRILPDLEIGAPSETTIFIIRLKKGDLFTQLMKRGIKVADIRNIPGLEEMGFVRVTIQSASKNAKLIKALIDIQKNMLY